MIFTDTITIYNHYKEDGHDKWQRTVLRSCQWRRKIIRSVDSAGRVLKTSEVSVTIPYRGGYVSAEEWEKLTDKRRNWTIDTECGLDMIALGEVEYELSEAYPPRKLKHDHADTITAATLSDSTNRDRLKHWKVTS